MYRVKFNPGRGTGFFYTEWFDSVEDVESFLQVNAANDEAVTILGGEASMGLTLTELIMNAVEVEWPDDAYGSLSLFLDRLRHAAKEIAEEITA